MPGAGAPPPLVWPCTAAPVLGLFCFRCQGLEKRLRLDDRRLAGKDLLHEDAVDFLIRVGTGYGFVNTPGQTITWQPPHY